MDELNNSHNMIQHDVSKMPINIDKVSMGVFNYWKSMICINSPEGFEYYQTFEMRVRLMSGIICAAWCGIIGALYIFISTLSIFHGIGLPLFLVSFTLLMIFGLNIHRVRLQEARELLLIYSAYVQQK